MSQRFSDAELAAEKWYAMYRLRVAEGIVSAFGTTTNLVLREHEAETLHRFATLPHAHEEPRAYVFQCEHCIGYWETDNEEHRNTFARNHQYLAHQRQG